LIVCWAAAGIAVTNGAAPASATVASKAMTRPCIMCLLCACCPCASWRHCVAGVSRHGPALAFVL